MTEEFWYILPPFSTILFISTSSVGLWSLLRTTIFSPFSHDIRALLSPTFATYNMSSMIIITIAHEPERSSSPTSSTCFSANSRKSFSASLKPLRIAFIGNYGKFSSLIIYMNSIKLYCLFLQISANSPLEIQHIDYLHGHHIFRKKNT